MITIDKPIHDLIIFGSKAVRPFAGSLSDRKYKGEYGDDERLQFFAFSTDGSKAGVLGDPDFAFLFWLPSEIYNAIKIIRYSYQLDTSILPASQLPAECYFSAGNNTMPCFEFQFSSNGKYFGYRYGEDIWMTDLRIINIQTGELVFTSNYGGNHFYLFTPDNRVLMAFGHDEGGGISLFDPKTLKHVDLGPESPQETVNWNNPHTAFVVDAHDYHGLSSNFWGYNLKTNQIFLRDYGVINAYTWIPDGSSVLYEKSDILKVSDIDGITYNVVRLMQAPISGTPHQILGHYNFDFHLCFELDYEYEERCKWIGDWFPIRRIPASERKVVSDDQDDCLSYGINCQSPTEHFWFNWRTGQLISPDDASRLVPTPAPTSTPTPTPTPKTGPDLARQPVYAHPSGAYAFYVGLDGNSLWLVPRVGAPVLWVAGGHNFIYIP